MRTYLLLRGRPRRGLPVAAPGQGTAKRWKRCCTTGECAENLNSRQNASSASLRSALPGMPLASRANAPLRGRLVKSRALNESVVPYIERKRHAPVSYRRRRASLFAVFSITEASLIHPVMPGGGAQPRAHLSSSRIPTSRSRYTAFVVWQRPARRR